MHYDGRFSAAISTDRGITIELAAADRCDGRARVQIRSIAMQAMVAAPLGPLPLDLPTSPHT
jgi:hypothetical protein